MTVTESKGARTRQHLLDAAVRRFATDGYRRTSVSDITRDAGLSATAAYVYFPNKEALFREAVNEDAANLIGRARPRVDERGSFAERWLGMPSRLCALLPEYPLARRVLAAQEPEVLADLLELPALTDLRAQLAADITAAQRTGQARPDVDADALALGFETIVLSQLMTGVHIPPDERRAAALITVLDAAIRAP
jgi:AcrR family transcriptional regulator